MDKTGFSLGWMDVGPLLAPRARSARLVENMSQKPAWLTAHGRPWLRGESKVAYENPWIRITEHDAVAPTAVVGIEPRGHRLTPLVRVLSLGLFGPNGPLPLHITEYVRDRIRNQNDPTLVAFADIFHHRILSLFVRNPNTFFTANELYQKIWGKDSLGDVRTVQVHIHNLRSKIEPDPAKPVYLCNVWGKGYVFRPEGKQE